MGFIGNGSANFVTINNIKTTVAGSHSVKIYCIVSGTRTFSVSVNGGTATTVSCTGTNWTGPVASPPTITVTLKASSTNTIQFSNSTAFAPDLDRITVK